MVSTLLTLAAISVLLAAYLWHANRSISTAPADAAKLTEKLWTRDEIQKAYQTAQTSPVDVRPYLFSKQNRRYIVTGGSGLAGGWIVQHLLMRGEDPAAVRIIDLSPPTRPEVAAKNIDFVKTDVSQADAVSQAFRKPWPKRVAALPLTVFHCVAYINPYERKAEFLSIYIKVNINGTSNVLNAAKNVGASCFISTSSASVGLRPPSYFPWPWQSRGKDTYQFLPNADPVDRRLDRPLHEFGACYAWTKAQAELMVCAANTPGFRTGCIRPGHAVYGHGVQNRSSITHDYLTRGGSPTWLTHVTTVFVNAQNVSIGHLAHEHALLTSSPAHPGGKSYCVTDPGPPLTYAHLYRTLTQLAHPATPVRFPYVPAILMLLPSYPLEVHTRLRYAFLGGRKWLPEIKGDLRYLQPAMFNLSTVHVVYSDERARREIGYVGPVGTLEGIAEACVDWNLRVEEGMGGEAVSNGGIAVPKGPSAH